MDPWQGETLLTTTAGPAATEASALAPALTILAHPDVERIGERAVLPLLALGRSARLARLEPVFSAPGGTRKQPLGERSISRGPIVLQAATRAPRGEPAPIRINARETRTRLLVDGRRVEDVHELGIGAFDRGSVLQVGRHVVLLLHHITVPTIEGVPPLGLIGESDGIVRLRRELERLAPLDVPVLLRGESGTGKELAARALHEGGARKSAPYVAVNMATLSPSLAAAELFGAVRGAYTGADRKKTGLFEGAEGGTLFLDEIGETPVEVQAMLLRVLEDHEILPVGSTKAQPVNVRIIAATDARLEEAMADGTFRTPLFHRLAGYAVRLPPLRERLDDLGRLLRFFLAEELRLLGQVPEAPPPFPPAEMVVRLARHGWPGNVRELRNVARRLAIAGPASDLSQLLESVEDLPLSEATGQARPSRAEESAPPQRRAPEIEDGELAATLRAHRWDVLNTAKALGVTRSALYRRLEKSDLFRKASDLDAAEIEAASRRCGGEIGAMADLLQVSERALQRRLNRLRKADD